MKPDLHSARRENGLGGRSKDDDRRRHGHRRTARQRTYKLDKLEERLKCRVHYTTHAEDQMRAREVTKTEVVAVLDNAHTEYPLPPPPRGATDVRVGTSGHREIKVYDSKPSDDEYVVHTVAVRGE